MYHGKGFSILLTAIVLIAILTSSTLSWSNYDLSVTSEWYGRVYGETDLSVADLSEEGGTLHFDANGANRELYIENWGQSYLYVRVRIYEYMEIGENAGDPSAKTATAFNSSSTILDKGSWSPHIPVDDETVHICGTGDVMNIHSYFEWRFGGQKYFYAAPVRKRKDKSYIDKSSPFDLTFSDTDTYGNPVKRTLKTDDVLTMRAWIKKGRLEGNYWVFDADGWAYWANQLAPSKATGLLLKSINMINTPPENYYYGIHIDVQTTSKQVHGNDNILSFFDEAHGSWTDEAKEMMEHIAANEPINNFSDNPMLRPTPTPTIQPLRSPTPSPVLEPLRSPTPSPALKPFRSPSPRPTPNPFDTNDANNVNSSPTYTPTPTPRPTPTLTNTPTPTPRPTPTLTNTPTPRWRR